jgi:hypothetical protein
MKIAGAIARICNEGGEPVDVPNMLIVIPMKIEGSIKRFVNGILAIFAIRSTSISAPLFKIILDFVMVFILPKRKIFSPWFSK